MVERQRGGQTPIKRWPIKVQLSSYAYAGDCPRLRGARAKFSTTLVLKRTGGGYEFVFNDT